MNVRKQERTKWQSRAFAPFLIEALFLVPAVLGCVRYIVLRADKLNNPTIGK